MTLNFSIDQNDRLSILQVWVLSLRSAKVPCRWMHFFNSLDLTNSSLAIGFRQILSCSRICRRRWKITDEVLLKSNKAFTNSFKINLQTAILANFISSLRVMKLLISLVALMMCLIPVAFMLMVTDEFHATSCSSVPNSMCSPLGGPCRKINADLATSLECSRFCVTDPCCSGFSYTAPTCVLAFGFCPGTKFLRVSDASLWETLTKMKASYSKVKLTCEVTFKD